MSNIKKYLEIFCEMFRIAPSEASSLSYQSIKEWDSVGHMNLMLMIEEEFDIEMDIDDITDFSSYKKGMEILAKYGVIVNE
jgi:acyl carrier protein